MALGKLGCGLSAMKYVIFIVNFIFFILGITLITVGSIVAQQVRDMESPLGGSNNLAIGVPAITIALGLFVLFGSAAGCFGVLRENICLIKAFFFFLILTILIELSTVIIVLVYSYDSKFESKLDRLMQEPFTHCQGSNVTDSGCSWIYKIQDKFKCCDFDTTTKMGPNNPYTNYVCAGRTIIEQEDYQSKARGFCNRNITHFIRRHLPHIAIILGGVLILELILTFGTNNLIRGIKKDNAYN